MNINTFWYSGRTNLGDVLTPLILERVYGVNPVLADKDKADLFSTGSILNYALWANLDDRTLPLQVVGSGFINEGPQLTPKFGIEIRSVRGYLTASRIAANRHFPEPSLGDPGLLTPWLVQKNASALSARMSSNVIRHAYGVVLHYVFANRDDLKVQLREVLGDVIFLDIQTDDIDGFAATMQKCDVILSHSLHGLIIADSLGIPNVWLNFGNLVGGSYKFFDYFSSVGRPFFQQLNTAPQSETQVLDAVSVPDSERIRSLQNDIDSSFKNAISRIAGDEVVYHTPESRRNLNQVKIAEYSEHSWALDRFPNNNAWMVFEPRGIDAMLRFVANVDQSLEIKVEPAGEQPVKELEAIAARNGHDWTIDRNGKYLKIHYQNFIRGTDKQVAEKVAGILDLAIRSLT